MPGSKIRQVEPNVTVVELTGHLNLGNELMRLENAVKRLIDDGARKLVFDVTRLDYIDSAGIGMLVGCNGQMDRAGGKMRVAGAHATVAKAFEVVHMDRITSLDADVDAALKNLF
jgi:anti-sigma B factor antagonist